MATIKLTTTTVSAICQAIIDAIDAGSGAALLRVYDGAMPAGPGTAVSTQTLLATLTLSDPCATHSGGVITFGAITQDTAADASGTASWARIVTSAGAAVLDVDVSNTAGSGALKFNSVGFVAGGPVQVTALTITLT